MARERKKPKAGASPKGGKKPSAAPDPIDSRNELIAWRFSLLDTTGPWGWRSVDMESHFDEVHAKLNDLEKLTVGELTGRAGNTPISTTQISAEAQRRLRQIKQDDLDTLWHLRLRGLWRVWGKLDGAIFYLLWWDPEHTVCPSELKHT